MQEYVFWASLWRLSFFQSSPELACNCRSTFSAAIRIGTFEFLPFFCWGAQGAYRLAPETAPCLTFLHMQLSCHAYVINLLSREIVKRAGAVWDSTQKLWFVHAGHDLRSVQKVLLTFVFYYFNIQNIWFYCLTSGLLLTNHSCKTFIRFTCCNGSGFCQHKCKAWVYIRTMRELRWRLE